MNNSRESGRLRECLLSMRMLLQNRTPCLFLSLHAACTCRELREINTRHAFSPQASCHHMRVGAFTQLLNCESIFRSEEQEYFCDPAHIQATVHRWILRWVLNALLPQHAENPKHPKDSHIPWTLLPHIIQLTSSLSAVSITQPPSRVKMRETGGTNGITNPTPDNTYYEDIRRFP